MNCFYLFYVSIGRSIFKETSFRSNPNTFSDSVFQQGIDKLIIFMLGNGQWNAAVGHGEVHLPQDGAAVIRHGEVTRLDHAPPPFPRGVSARSTSRSSPTLSRMTASVHAKRSVVCRYSFDS